MMTAFLSFIRCTIISYMVGCTLTIFCDPLINFNDDCDAIRQEYISMNFTYGFPTDQVIESEVGGGLVTWDVLNGIINFATAPSGSSASLTTLKTVPANPGDEVYAIFSALFERTTDATLQLIGLYNDSNGMAVGYLTAAGPFSIVYRNDGVDTVVPQTSFNVDPLDGTGPSGFVLNPATLNSYRVSYVWYGTNIVRYQILNGNNEWITFHEIENVNSLFESAFSNPYLPMRAEQVNPGTPGAADLLYVKGWKAGVIHSGETNAGIRTFDAQQTFTTVSTTETYMFTIRDKTTFGGEPNAVIARLRRVGGGNTIDQTSPVIVRYYKNASIIAPVFTDINTDNSIMEIDTSAAGFSDGHFLWSTGDAGLIFETLPDNEIEFFIGPGESITVTAQKLTINPIPMYATAMWDEYQ